MRSSAIAGSIVVLGLLLVSNLTVELPPSRPNRAVPRILRAVARREDGTLAGIVVENGRLLEARLSLREGRSVLTPPRWGIPVVDDTGGIHERVADFLDRLAMRDEAGHSAGVVEIELSVGSEVPESVRATFRRFLSQRGIRAIPW